jgi:hypothetical protein
MKGFILSLFFIFYTLTNIYSQYQYYPINKVSLLNYKTIETKINLKLQTYNSKNKRVFTYKPHERVKFTLSTGINRINQNNIDVLSLNRYDARLRIYFKNTESIVFRFQVNSLRGRGFSTIGFTKKF